jgi:hypothetical protein
MPQRRAIEAPRKMARKIETNVSAKVPALRAVDIF